MRKPNPSRVLTKLPEEQQAQLAEWLLGGVPYHRAREMVEKEFGARVSLSQLGRFWEDVCSSEIVRRRQRAVSTAEVIAEEASKSPGRFDQATIDSLKQQALELSLNPSVDPKSIKSIFSLVLKARDQDLKESQLAIDKEKLELELQKYRDQVAEQKRDIEGALAKAKTGGLTQETLDLIEQKVRIL